MPASTSITADRSRTAATAKRSIRPSVSRRSSAVGTQTSPRHKPRSRRCHPRATTSWSGSSRKVPRALSMTASTVVACSSMMVTVLMRSHSRRCPPVPWGPGSPSWVPDPPPSRKRRLRARKSPSSDGVGWAGEKRTTPPAGVVEAACCTASSSVSVRVTLTRPPPGAPAMASAMGRPPAPDEHHRRDGHPLGQRQSQRRHVDASISPARDEGEVAPIEGVDRCQGGERIRGQSIVNVGHLAIFADDLAA